MRISRSLRASFVMYCESTVTLIQNLSFTAVIFQLVFLFNLTWLLTYAKLLRLPAESKNVTNIDNIFKIFYHFL